MDLAEDLIWGLAKALFLLVWFSVPVLGVVAAGLVAFSPQRRRNAYWSAGYALLAILQSTYKMIATWGWWTGIHIAGVALACIALLMSMLLIGAWDRPRASVLAGLTGVACFASALGLIAVILSGSGY